MKHNILAPLGAAALAGLCACPHAVHSQDEAAGTLAPLILSATRVPSPPQQTGSAVTQVSGQEIEHRQIKAFEDILKLAPGAAFATTGQRGSNSSLFLRGVNSNQTQFVIDGVRINDANILPNPFLGSVRAQHLASVEILRGPQSALYGGEAIGGVLSLTTPRGQGDPRVTWDASYGSFDSWETSFAAQAAEGPAAWSLSLNRESTNNARLHNGFEQFSYSARFDFDLNPQARTGFTLRGFDNTFESPGDRFTNDPGNLDLGEFLLATTWLDLDLHEAWNSRLTLGFLEQRLRFEFPPFGSTRIENQKSSLDWRHILQASESLTTVLGIAYEEIDVRNTGFGSIDDRETILAAYGQQSVRLLDQALTLTGGGRWEEYDGFGSVWTWRTTGAYHVAASDTTLRASYGTGFRAPSFFELYARSAFFAGNPDLQPETSRGWDAGIEQALPGTSATAALTWFSNDLRNLIETDFAVFPATVINLGQAHTQGLEAALRGEWQNRLFWQAAYTYLLAEDETRDVRLLRRPEHTLGLDLRSLWWDRRFTLGAGLYHLQNRRDVDARTFATIDGDDFTVARFYAALEVTDNLSLHLRLENAFDEDYEEVDGFPGLPQAFHAGLRLRF